MEIKKLKISLSILASLVVISFAFFVAAKDDTSGKNILLDSDHDGLTDQEEKTYGTDPRNTDTDKDGYSDGAEVKSGYDPLKPAPGDKIIKDTSSSTTSKNATGNSENLTSQIAQKITAMTLSPTSEDQTVNLGSISEMVDSALDQNGNETILPEINRDQIKIKKQNYSGFSEKKRAEKKKEDFTNYIAALYYVLSSNSPEPITSGSDITKIFSSLTSQITKSISSRSVSNLEDINKSGEKILDQIKQIEVPEELVDIHIKALQFAQYSKNVQGYLNPNSEDPMADIANLSKLEGLVTNLMSFSEDVQTKFSEYDLTYDELQEKVKAYGANLPEDQTIISSGTDTMSDSSR